MGLESGKGPRGIEYRERVEGHARRCYVGVIERFKYFDKDRFLVECQHVSDNDAVQPADLCERLLLDALYRTSQFLQNHSYTVLRGRESEYVGPQLYEHRHDTARMQFSPNPNIFSQGPIPGNLQRGSSR